MDRNGLIWDDTIDDTILSQAATAVDKESAVLDGFTQLSVSKTVDTALFPELSNCTLTQVMDTYDVNLLSPTHGNFKTR